jgi:hypothetical protein
MTFCGLTTDAEHDPALVNSLPTARWGKFAFTAGQFSQY